MPVPGWREATLRRLLWSRLINEVVSNRVSGVQASIGWADRPNGTTYMSVSDEHGTAVYAQVPPPPPGG